jgi:hypothetical protein
MLAESKLNFKHMVLSRLNKLEDIPYIIRKLWMSSFQLNLNHIKIYSKDLVMTRTIAEGQN